ncbi:putative ribonuclease H-like domain-containing protein [Tanacetum coccineum]
MDVKSAFIYGKIEEDVYVCQPPSFEDPDFPNKVYKVENALYGLHQAQGMPRKYVAEILKKLDFASVKTASTPIEPNKALIKDEEAEDVDVHLYRSMIGSLMLISWQCKKQTIVTNSTTEAEYVAAVNCYGQVLWIQNQMLDYGFNFMNTKIHIDNESTICIVKNPVFHSKTKHIEIRHHFIRDSYEKKLIQVIKIHTDHNVADLLTKAFDVSRKAKRITEISQSSGPIHLVTDETVYKEWEDRIEMAATTASSLEAEQDSGNINRTQSMAILNESFPQGTVSGSGPSGKDNMKLMELMEHCTKLSELVKTVNGERQIQALVDKKKVIISETSIRSDLKLDDAKGTNCLPTATIFAELERMGAKTTSWNKFSSTMASAIICLATNQKFNLSKYIFDNMVKNLDGGVKFLMYPRFVQVFLDKQVEGMSKNKGVYVTPSHTKKVFANLKKPCKGFSGRVTPLFSTMMVQATEDIAANSATPTDSHSTPIITQPSSSKPQKKKSRRKQRKDSASTEPTTEEATPKEHVSTPSYDPPLSGEDRMQLAELMSLCTNLQEKVLDLEKAKTAQAKEITSLKKRVKQLEKRRKSRTSGLRRLRKVGSSSRVESSNDASLGAQEDASKQGRKIEDLDADAEVTLVNETQEMNDDNLMFDTGVLEEQEIEFEKVVEEPVVSVATTTKSIPVSVHFENYIT